MPTRTEPRRNVELAAALARDGRPLYVLGGLAEVNPRRLTLIVQGREQPSPAVRARLAQTLGCAEEDLFEDPA